MKKAPSVKDGTLTWQEFLDFFFARGIDPLDRLGHNQQDWWFKIDMDGKEILPKEDTPRVVVDPFAQDTILTSSQKKAKEDRDNETSKVVPMTPAL